MGVLRKCCMGFLLFNTFVYDFAKSDVGGCPRESQPRDLLRCHRVLVVLPLGQRIVARHQPVIAPGASVVQMHSQQFGIAQDQGGGEGGLFVGTKRAGKVDGDAKVGPPPF